MQQEQHSEKIYWRKKLDEKPSPGKRKIKTLLVRDGHNCWLCGEPFAKKSGRKPSLDHVIPRSKGGTMALTNLKLAHSFCNQKRGNSDIIG